MNKSGNVLDWFLVIPILFMAAVGIFVALMIVSTVNTSNVFSGTPEAQNAIDSTQSTILSFDNLFLFVIVGLSIFVLVSSALVFNHPAFFISSVILLSIAVTVAAAVSNAFWSFANQDTIAATAAQFPKITFLMNKLPWYITFMGFAAAIVMYIGYNKQ